MCAWCAELALRCRRAGACWVPDRTTALVTAKHASVEIDLTSGSSFAIAFILPSVRTCTVHPQLAPRRACDGTIQGPMTHQSLTQSACVFGRGGGLLLGWPVRRGIL